MNWLTQNVTLHRASQSRTNNESETGHKCLLNSSLSWEANRAAFVRGIIHSKIVPCCLCVYAFPFCSFKRYGICSCMDCLEMGLTREKCTLRLVRTCFRVRGQGKEQLQKPLVQKLLSILIRQRQSMKSSMEPSLWDGSMWLRDFYVPEGSSGVWFFRYSSPFRKLLGILALSSSQSGKCTPRL